MTAIAGLIDNGKVWIGGDSAGVGGYSLHLRNDPKVFRNGEFLIGYTSSFRMGQILRFHMSPDTPTEGQDEYEYMVKSFVNSMRSALKNNGWMKTDEGRERAGTFMVGWRGKLYLIEGDMQVAELRTPYAACGCGEDLSLGSLHATSSIKSKLTAKKRIELALQAAESFSAGVRGPFTILST